MNIRVTLTKLGTSDETSEALRNQIIIAIAINNQPPPAPWESFSGREKKLRVGGNNKSLRGRCVTRLLREEFQT